MSNFKEMGYESSMSLAEVAHELHIRQSRFGENRIRQFDGSPHWQVDDVLLSGPDLDQGLVEVHNDIRCGWYETAHAFPATRVLVEDLAASIGATEIGRVIITKLASGATIKPHIDEGDAAEYYDRYHFCVQGEPGSVFIVEQQSQQMRAGEFWWVNNRKVHSVINNSIDDRIHIVMDFKC